MQNQSSQYDNESQRPIIVKSRINGMGIAGFVLSIIALIYPWIMMSVVNPTGKDPSIILIPAYILLLLAVVFSIIGLFKRPRAFAVAGLCVSVFAILLN